MDSYQVRYVHKSIEDQNVISRMYYLTTNIADDIYLYHMFQC